MSMSAQAYKEYYRTSVETTTPGKLLLMLYDGAIKKIVQAREAIEQNDISTAHTHIITVQKIMVELMTTLNMDYALSENLYALYEYMYNQLVAANVKKDVALLDEVEGFMVDLRNTWDQAIKSLGKESFYHANTLKSLNISG
ncbi:MAG TPA: flagellar export chaperone FliS [Syntrophomonadaceae bacterium]|nr:flagellar export chaperone FliS [Syntrophomonadaceae bacterium]